MDNDFTDQTLSLLKDGSLSQNENTIRSYKNKKFEFGEYCEMIFGNEKNPQFVTEAKVFGFLNYTAYRRKNTTRHVENDNSPLFDIKDFREVSSQDNDEEKIIGKELLGYDSVNQYFCAIKELSSFQNFNQNSRGLKDDLNSFRVKSLFKKIKSRRETNRKVLYKERLEGDFLPFKMAESIPAIENFMWESNNNTSLYGLGSLRDRFQFLITLGGVTRSESMYKGDISDLCDLKFKSDCEKDSYHILLMRIGTGKTVKEKPIYCKSLRHKDARLCSIGSLGLYLLGRFHYLDELKRIDFMKNSSWFNIKLLVSSRSSKYKSKGPQANGKYNDLHVIKYV